MIDLLKLLLALLLPFLVGYVITCIIMPKKENISNIERLALSFLIGTGTFTLLIFLLGAFGISFTLLNIISATIIVMAALVIIAAKNGSLMFDLRSMGFARLKWHEIAFLALILLRVSFVLFEDLVKPVFSVDAFANWSLRAKVSFLTAAFPLRPRIFTLLEAGSRFTRSMSL